MTELRERPQGEVQSTLRGKSTEGVDPLQAPSYSFMNRAMRLLWGVVYALLYKTSPRTLHGWRQFLLQLFGAKMGEKCRFYPNGKVWAPWNLRCEDSVTLADGAELYNPSMMYLGSHCIVSQYAYVCGATHRYDDALFTLVSYPMRLGAYSWVCAKAIVSPGVNLGNGAVLGLGSIATRDLEAFGVYAGVPAKKVKERAREAVPEKYR